MVLTQPNSGNSRSGNARSGFHTTMVLTQPMGNWTSQSLTSRFHTTMVLTQPASPDYNPYKAVSSVSIPLWFLRNSLGPQGPFFLLTVSIPLWFLRNYFFGRKLVNVN